jgi:hypothetical protein
MTRRAWTASLMTAMLAGAVHTAAAAQKPPVNPAAAAQADFQARLDQYIKLREDLAGKLKPLTPTASAAELAARQESLAAALRDVRKNAKQGDLIPPAVAAQIKRIVAADFRRRNPMTKRAVFEEVPTGVRPVINKPLPDAAALATIPPLLLNELPRLPDNLQYRFVGHDIILLDGDTRLIMDYISNAVPAH